MGSGTDERRGWRAEQDAARARRIDVPRCSFCLRPLCASRRGECCACHPLPPDPPLPRIRTPEEDLEPPVVRRAPLLERPIERPLRPFRPQNRAVRDDDDLDNLEYQP